MSTEPPVLADRLLRSALDHAVRVALLGSRRTPVEPFPAPLRRFFSTRTLSAASLAAVRRCVEADESFRRRAADAASPDLVDEVGRLWLGRPDGWEERIGELLAASSTAAGLSAAEASAALSGEARRRKAAEDHRDRLERELRDVSDRLGHQVDELRAQLDTALADVARLERDLVEARGQARNAAARAVRAEQAAGTSAAATGGAAAEIEALRARVAAAEQARDAALADRALRAGDAIDRDRLRTALVDALAALGAEQRTTRPGVVRRIPLGLPGGVRAESAAGVEHLCRADGVLVLVDGYNVAKLAWPTRSLEQQREACIAAAESIATRWGTRLVVVFDGSDVPGASTRGRRLVTVTYSPEGVTADDVIRRLVAAEPATRPVVVVTNDRAIRDDVQAQGANPLSSDAFVAALR